MTAAGMVVSGAGALVADTAVVSVEAMAGTVAAGTAAGMVDMAVMAAVGMAVAFILARLFITLIMLILTTHTPIVIIPPLL